jgi:hypothetical protein
MSAQPDKRIAEVVEILGRNKARVDVIEEAVRTLDNEMWAPWSKKDKAVARSLGGSLERAVRTLARPDVVQLLDRLMIEADGGIEDLKKLRKYIEELETLPLDKPKPSAAKFLRKNEAVAAAAQLLEHHGLRLTVTRKTESRRASLFCRVAAALFGNKHEDLSHQCRAFMKKARNRVVK